MKKRKSSKPSANILLGRRTVRNQLKEKAGTFKGNLFQSVDPMPLGIFRLLFGLLLSIEFFVVSRNTFLSDYINPSFHFTYPLFDFLGLKPLPKSDLWVMFYIMRVSTIGITLGLLTRISLFVFTSTFGYFFFMESAVYSNHYYLIFLLSLLLCFGHSGTVLSLDSLIKRNNRTRHADYWEIFMLRFQICIVFLFGGLAKVNKSWLIDAAPVYLNLIKHLSLLGYPLHEHWIAAGLSWGGMISDFALGIALAVNRWPKSTFVWLCLFNGLNICLFGLGIKTFPYLMIASYVLFLPSPVVRRSVARLLNVRFLQFNNGDKT